MDKTTEINVPDHVRGEIAYALTKRLVIDMPTARAAVDDAIEAVGQSLAIGTSMITKEARRAAHDSRAQERGNGRTWAN